MEDKVTFASPFAAKPNNSSFLRPGEVVDALELKRNATVADFGCGAGFFSIPIAKAASEGKLYALDIQESELEAVASQARTNGIHNIETAHVDLEQTNGSRLENDSCDLVLIANLFHQVDKDKVVAKEAVRVVKSKGRILVIDWQAKESPFGPATDKRISAKEVLALFAREGLKLEKRFQPSSYHFGILLS